MKVQELMLIVYKGKILLASLDSQFDRNIWSFVGESGRWSNSPIDSAKKVVKNITQLNLLSISRVSLSDSNSDYVLYTKLTDKNVNSIERRNGQRLEFYSLKEAEKLNLSNTTELLIKNFRNKISTLLEV